MWFETVAIWQVVSLDRQGLLRRNFENPPVMDTVTVPDGGYVVLRFRANNPGEVYTEKTNL